MKDCYLEINCYNMVLLDNNGITTHPQGIDIPQQKGCY